MAFLISGCVQVSETQYAKKCENCGAVAPGTTQMPKVTKGTTHNSSFMCHKCKKLTKIVIKG